MNEGKERDGFEAQVGDQANGPGCERGHVGVDPRDGGNIAPDGTVLFLDEERLARRENPRPMRKNRPTGLGVRDLVAHVAAKKIASSNGLGPLFENVVSTVREPVESKASKKTYRMLGFDDDDPYGYTHVTVLPLNVDLADEADKRLSVIVPMDLIFAELEEATEIAIMNECICRASFECEHYPRDFGCIFLGPLARHAIKQKRAHAATLEEAKAHVRKAAELGLMASAEFVEGEQMIWGVKNAEMNSYRMFCFCCECCCLALKVVKEGQRDVRKRYTGSGWSMVVNHDECVGCRTCERHCPQRCISYREDGTCVIDQEYCVGCGFCKQFCKHDALKIVQTTPTRPSINEFMLKEVRIDDGRHHRHAVPGESRWPDRT